MCARAGDLNTGHESLTRILPSLAFLPVPVAEAHERSAWLAGLNDLIESRLSQDTRFRMVSRSDIDLVLKEIDLSASSLRHNGLLEAGQLLKADILMLTRIDGSGGEADNILLKVVRLKDGLILHCSKVALDSNSDMQTLAAGIVAALGEGFDVSPGKEGTTIAVTALRNLSIFDRLDTLRYELRDELTARLADTPGIAPVERADLRMLLEEDRLPVSETNTAPVAVRRQARYVLLGSMKEITDSSHLRVELDLVLVDQERRRVAWKARTMGPVADWKRLAQGIVSNVVAAIASPMPGDNDDGFAAETDHLLHRAEILAAETCVRSGDPLWRGAVPGIKLPDVRHRYEVQSSKGKLIFREACDLLRTRLYLCPEDHRSHILLGKMLAWMGWYAREWWMSEEAVYLLEHVARRDPEGAFGTYAKSMLGGALVSASLSARTVEQHAMVSESRRRWFPEKTFDQILDELAAEFGRIEQMPLDAQKQHYLRLYNQVGGLLEAKKSPTDRAALIDILERHADSEALVVGLVARIRLGDSYYYERIRATPEPDANAAVAQYRRAIDILEGYTNTPAKVRGWLENTRWEAVTKAVCVLSYEKMYEELIEFCEPWMSVFKAAPWNKGDYLTKLSEAYEKTGKPEAALRMYEYYHSFFPQHSTMYGYVSRIQRLRKSLNIEATGGAPELSFDTYPCPGSSSLQKVVAAGDMLYCINKESELYRFDTAAAAWTRVWDFGRNTIPAADVAVVDGRLAVSAGGNGVLISDEGMKTWARFTETNGLPHPTVTVLASDGSTLALGFGDNERGCVALWEGGSHFRVLEGRDAPVDNVMSLVVDKNHIWVGTANAGASGVLWVMDRKTEAWQRVGGYCQVDPALEGVYAAGAGFGMSAAHIRIKDGKPVIDSLKYAMPECLQHAKDADLYIDRIFFDHDRYWIKGNCLDALNGSSVYSVTKLKDDTLRMYSGKDRIHLGLTDFAQSPDGQLWIASDMGLVNVTYLDP
jgi:TolB-like protein/tetratricopeptide (TPR) repeat protein